VRQWVADNEGAQENLKGCADRVRYVLADLSQPGGIAKAVEAAGGKFDVVVSASFVHNLHDDERVKGLYRELREAVNPGGGFLNMDNMSAGSPLLQSVWQRGRLEQYRRRRLAETGTLPSVAEAEEALHGERRRRFGIPKRKRRCTASAAAVSASRASRAGRNRATARGTAQARRHAAAGSRVRRTST
jgi:hypothetical protein